MFSGGWYLQLYGNQYQSFGSFVVCFLVFANEGLVSAAQQCAEITPGWQGELADALNYRVESLSINRSRRLDGAGLFQGLNLCKKKSDPKHYL